MLRKLLPLLLLTVCSGASSIAPSPAMAGLGFQSFGFAATNADGGLDTQAGSHPFQMTTAFTLPTTLNPFGKAIPSGSIKTVVADLPPGLVGSATAVPQCSQKLFATVIEPEHGPPFSDCGNASVVGIARVSLGILAGQERYVPIFNLVPPPGLPAEFGFLPGFPVVLVPSVVTNGNYGLRVESVNTSQAVYVFGSSVTFWGVPADPRHDALRGSCLNLETGGSKGECPANVAPKPFLTLPTACSGPPAVTLSADSWEEPEVWVPDEARTENAQGVPTGIGGCSRLEFNPSLTVQPDTTAADTPTGLAVGLSLPQNENPEGLAEADVRKVAMTLPAGLSASPSAANGREACTEAQIALHSTAPAQCPNASKVGSVTIESPLLERPLEGWVYLAQQNSNPFGGLLGLYLVAEGYGVRIKLAGGIEANPTTGQLTTHFEELPAQQLAFPQLPFSELKLKLFGGPRAALVTPQGCGTYTATGQLTPWSSPLPASVSSSFPIDSGCASQFKPSFMAGTTSIQAGGFSPFTATFSRTDQDQDLSDVTVQTPPGLLGMLANVPLCPEPQAGRGVCPAASQIGHVTVSAGAGPDSVVLPQAGRPEDPVYLTGPLPEGSDLSGAPFGLSIVEHAEAGPFNLGTIVVRAAIDVDPHTAQATVRSQPLPQILQGIPTQVKSVTVTLDREGFIFNPTSCNPLAVTATALSTLGSSAALTSRFQAAGCQALTFKPTFAISTQAKTSRKSGASLHVKVTSGPGQANIAQVKVDIPKQLPSRLTTLQKACLARVFEANPASCPAASLVGTATAHTAVLGSPLTGPAYLVSHGGAAFPDLVIVLQGEGVTLELDGLTGIKDGITSSTFRSVPDAPVSTFELTLPEGPYSVFSTNLPATAKDGLCGQSLVAPTAIVGQDGATIDQNTRIAVTGCPTRHKAHRATHR
jgi:hypothetical protein